MTFNSDEETENRENTTSESDHDSSEGEDGTEIPIHFVQKDQTSKRMTQGPQI